MTHASHCRNRPPCALRLALALCLTLLLPFALAAPTDIVLVLDNSGSMRGNDPQFLLKSAVTRFVSALDADTRVGIVIFAEKAAYPVPLAPLDVTARAAIQQTIDGIDYRGQWTNSPAAMERAIYELKTTARADAAKVIVFMSDGIVDTGNKAVDGEKSEWMRDELAADAADNAIKIFGIAFTEDADFFLIQSLAKKTDGAYFRALMPEDLEGAFETVQQKIAAPPVAAPAPPPVAAPPVAAPPEAAPPAAAPAATASACLAALLPEDRTSLEEMAKEAGLTAEQLCQEMQEAPPGTAVVVPPPGAQEDDDLLGLALVIGAIALLLVVLAVAVVLLLRRRGSAPATAAPAAGSAPISEAFIKDINHLTDEPAMQLGAKPVIIGRMAGADAAHLDYFVINKSTIGRRHAIIKYHDFAFWLMDQGSVNGTFLNGERIEGERQLKHGDRIRFHKYEFEFSMPEMDDGGHTVFADPNDPSLATMVGEATMIGGAAASAAAVAADRSEDIFDLTGGAHGAADDRADAFDDAIDTALSARARAAKANFGDETEEGDSDIVASALAQVADDDDDDAFVTVAPSFGKAAAGSSAQADFDAEASAFFDEDELGATSAPANRENDMDEPVVGQGDFDDDAEAATLIRPAGMVASRDAGDASESATLLPGALAKEEALEATSDISLDEFMQTEAFDAPVRGFADSDDDDATLMPDQVRPAPAIDDVLDLTAERTIPPVGARVDHDHDHSDDDSEGPTLFRR